MKETNLSLTKIKVSELKQGFFIFGNKGAVWNDKCHIAQAGFHSETLCGVPMLSSNYAEHNKLDVGCEACIEKYMKLIEVENEPFADALYKDEIYQELNSLSIEGFWKDLCIIENKYRVRSGLKIGETVSTYEFGVRELEKAENCYNDQAKERLEYLIELKNARH